MNKERKEEFIFFSKEKRSCIEAILKVRCVFFLWHKASYRRKKKFIFFWVLRNDFVLNGYFKNHYVVSFFKVLVDLSF